MLKRKPISPTLPETIPDHAFQAVPEIPPAVESRHSPASGETFLRYRTRPSSTLESWMGKVAGWKRHRRFVLDETGTFFWSRIDGQRTLGEIAQEMQNRFGWSANETRTTVVSYTMTLTKRRLILLDLSYRTQESADE